MRSSFLNAQRQLRSFRALDALGQAPSNATEGRFRDQLLPELFETLITSRTDYEHGELIEAAVSVGLARLDEDKLSYLAALATSVEVLATNGQFARIRALSKAFKDIADRIEHERPYLAVALRAFGDTSAGRREVASRSLSAALGLESGESEPLQRVPSNWPAVGEVALANAFRVWLSQNKSQPLLSIREVCEEQGDGLLYAIASLFMAYAEVDSEFAIAGVVRGSSEILQTDALNRYFSGRNIQTLYPAQSAAIKAGLLEPGSRLIAMPTSSGKTLLAELKIAAELFRKPGGRAVYLSPYRLLARQVAKELQNGLRLLGFAVQDVGDTFDTVVDEFTHERDFPDVAVMTFERLDALLRLANSDRRGKELASDFIDSLVVIVMDEVQLLGRPSRGPRLELFLARLRRSLPHVTVLGLAAATGGVSALANWLRAEEFVSRSARPTGLIELEWKANGSIFQRTEGKPHRIGHRDRSPIAINDAASLLLDVPDERYPILVVETTRSSAENIVRKVARLAPRRGDIWRDSLPNEVKSSLDATADMVDATMGDVHDLGDLIRQGLAYHHAGVPGHLLAAIEGLIKQGAIRVIGATTTVAEGADLPFQIVVIPHLNFNSSGASSKLSPELYRNIVGRAGRANVAVEGIAIIVGSKSSTLVNHVENELWRGDGNRNIEGQLDRALTPPLNIQEYRAHREARSQILAWLGDEGAYVEEQAAELASSTFTFRTSSVRERATLQSKIQTMFADFETEGLAEAASPYRLTSIGRRSRLAGMSLSSCLRLSAAVERISDNAFSSSLTGTTEITEELASLIASIVFEAEEVIEWSIWFKKLDADEADSVQVLSKLANGERSWPYEDPLYAVDLKMLSGWIGGRSYSSLGDIPPIFGGRGAFGTTDKAARASDAAEQLNRIAPSAAWAWGAAISMLGDDGNDIPQWIRGAIELGVPTESGVELMQRFEVSRACAIALSEALESDWETAQFELADLSQRDLRTFGVTAVDRRLLRSNDDQPM